MWYSICWVSPLQCCKGASDGVLNIGGVGIILYSCLWHPKVHFKGCLSIPTWCLSASNDSYVGGWWVGGQKRVPPEEGYMCVYNEESIIQAMC